MKEINPQTWQKLADGQGKYQIIDVRTAFEFGAEHLANSINIPLDEINTALINERFANTKLLLICQSGARSRKASEKLCDYTEEILCLEGGLNAWKKEGFETEELKNIISLERQVRICAGLLILTGIILMKLGFNGAEYLSAFVGAGLMFAGITDTCGMGILLTKMPWNRL
ncbi:rhodanese-like domain-containing protein [Lentisphaera profundi]|uniref:Rhodanese-like domain-containing protein n=1 Tax=Lentisphaera profundi TaxID=1658616 RepID=A0ABY7VUS7_9BACT|nr:rhodanese-like domain-containing protein [Lentisphaera profundi]WDE95863.1 rhodanese-like domain-containing protein [Lentisphaera profundi]